jgi:hypothetical protein
MRSQDKVNKIRPAFVGRPPKETESTVALDVDDMVDSDLSRIIERAYRESVDIGTTYDIAVGAAVRAVMAVYPNLSRDEALDQIVRLRVPPY